MSDISNFHYSDETYCTLQRSALIYMPCAYRVLNVYSCLGYARRDEVCSNTTPSVFDFGANATESVSIEPRDIVTIDLDVLACR